MKDNISPEEKLLKLIRGQKKPLNLKPTVEYSIHTLILSRPSFLNIKKIIWVFFAVSCLYLIASFIYPWLGFKKIKLPQVSPKEITELKKDAAQEIKPYEFYLEGVKNRQIFGRVTTQREASEPISSLNTDFLKDMNLIGIISGNNPQAVIEDKKLQKTFYLNKGQFIGEFQVEDIQEGKIILNYRGEKFELYL